MTFDFGNPTKNAGAFFDMFHGRNALPADHRWSIDSRTVKITNKALGNSVYQISSKQLPQSDLTAVSTAPSRIPMMPPTAHRVTASVVN